MLFVKKASVLHRQSASSTFFFSLYTCLPSVVQTGRGVHVDGGGGVNGDSSETLASSPS